MLIQMGVTVVVKNSEFKANRSPVGGAIAIWGESTLMIERSSFRDNSVSHQFGGDISAEMSTLTIEDCAFFDGSAPGVGASLYLNRLSSIKILHSTFSPMVDSGDQQTVFIAGRLGGCNEHPCSPGQQCSYLNYSLACQPCDETTQSSEGLQCTSCEAGTQPNLDRTGCEPCSGNEYSAFGMVGNRLTLQVFMKKHLSRQTPDNNRNSINEKNLFGQCEPCPDSLVVDAEHIGCTECGVHRTAVAIPGQSSKTCDCAEGFYDEAESVHVCFRDGECASSLLVCVAQSQPHIVPCTGYSISQETAAIENRESQRTLTGQSCAACVRDVEGEECVICSADGPTLIRAGFRTPDLSTRRMQVQTDLTFAGRFIFRCHNDLEVAAKRCP